MATFASGSLMCAVSHEEAFGCLSSMGTLSHEQKWPIISKSCVGDSVEVHRHECEGGQL